MKINKLETHDRFQHLVKDQSINISEGAEDCLRKNPLSLSIQDKSPYIYLFAHPRTAEDGVNKQMYWQPRLSIPKAETNSYLFRAISKTDIIEICWLIPPQEQWGQNKKGNIVENPIVEWSISQYKNNRLELEKPHPDDISEERAKIIMKSVIDEHRQSLKNKNMHYFDLV